MSKVYIASDHAGFKLKLELIKFIQNELKLQVEDVGCHSADRCDYPDFSLGLGKAVLNDPSSQGIAICGSGIGISLGCNKLNGITCGLSHDYLTARYAKEHLNCNILAIGERVIGQGVAEQMIKVFLTSEYKPTPDSQAFAEEIAKIENEIQA